MGVDMPRTPAVFPEKLRWSLKEQAWWGGDSLEASRYVGTTRTNYSSALEFVDEVEATLIDQARRDQILVLPVEAARERYGNKLAIASLGGD